MYMDNLYTVGLPLIWLPLGYVLINEVDWKVFQMLALFCYGPAVSSNLDSWNVATPAFRPLYANWPLKWGHLDTLAGPKGGQIRGSATLDHLQPPYLRAW